MKILTLTGKTHAFRKTIALAMADVRSARRNAEVATVHEQQSITDYKDGDIILCQRFVGDVDNFHRVRMHAFYETRRDPRFPTTASSFIPDQAVPHGRWEMFTLLDDRPFPVNLRGVLPETHADLAFRNGEDETDIAVFLQRFIGMSKGKKLRFFKKIQAFIPIVENHE